MDSNKPNSRKIQAEESRLRILDTALAVFGEKGFANTTIKDLADAAGISTGLMYHYFPGKEKLLEAAVEQHSFLPQLGEILNNTSVSPCREVLKDISLKFIDLLNRKNTIFRIFFQEGTSNAKVKKVWSNLIQQGVRLLEKYISASITDGELRPHKAEVTARCLFSNIIMFHFTRELFKSSKVTESQFVDEMLDIILQGIGSTER